MFCGECGTQNPDTNQFCKNCGKPLRKAGPVPATQPSYAPMPPAAAPPRPLPVAPVPVPAVPISHAPLPVPAQPDTQGAPSLRNWFAIVSFIVSLVSWLAYPIILGLISVILGIFSLYWAKKKRAKIPVSGIFAIIIGLLSIIVNFFWLDIFPAPEVLPPIK